MRNEKTLDCLEAQTIARLAKQHNYAFIPEVLEGFVRVAAVIRGEVSSWSEIPIERRNALLARVRAVVSQELRAFDHECKARDDNE